MKLFITSLILFLCFSFKPFGQIPEEKIKTVKKVYDKIVKAYADSRPEPKLEIIAEADGQNVIALYTAVDGPTVKIDEKLVDICLGLKADSLNALAIIISHELAHYYLKHTFCIDYAYAADKKSNIRKDLTKYHMSPESKIQRELEADESSLFFASAAGYKPFAIFNNMLTTIFKKYKLTDANTEYPSKSQRIQFKNECLKKVNTLYSIFKAGIILAQIGMFEEAAACFDKVKSNFKSRENYNNAGVARLCAAIKLKPTAMINFIYPIEIDATSLLNGHSTRGINDNSEKIKNLLQRAEEDFEEAHKIDRNHTRALINLACVLSMRNNVHGAIGKLNDIPSSDTGFYSNTINMVKAIAYHNDEDTTNSGVYFKKLIIGKDSIINYNISLYNLKDELGSNPIQQYKNAWRHRNEKLKGAITESQKSYIQQYKLIIEDCEKINDENNISICSNKSYSAIEIYLNNKKIIKGAEYPGTSALIIQLQDDWVNENNKIFKWFIHTF